MNEDDIFSILPITEEEALNDAELGTYINDIKIPWAVISACSGDFTLAIWIIVLWIIMSVVRQFIEPRMVSGKIGIHPIFTLIAMYTGFKFIGVIGMFIGPIILIILKNIFSTFIDKGVFKSIFER